MYTQRFKGRSYKCFQTAPWTHPAPSLSSMELGAEVSDVFMVAHLESQTPSEVTLGNS